MPLVFYLKEGNMKKMERVIYLISICFKIALHKSEVF